MLVLCGLASLWRTHSNLTRAEIVPDWGLPLRTDTLDRLSTHSCLGDIYLVLTSSTPSSQYVQYSAISMSPPSGPHKGVELEIEYSFLLGQNMVTHKIQLPSFPFQKIKDKQTQFLFLFAFVCFDKKVEFSITFFNNKNCLPPTPLLQVVTCYYLSYYPLTRLSRYPSPYH